MTLRTTRNLGWLFLLVGLAVTIRHLIDQPMPGHRMLAIGIGTMVFGASAIDSHIREFIARLLRRNGRRTGKRD